MPICKICGSCTFPETYQQDAYEKHIVFRCLMNCREGETVIIERIPWTERREINTNQNGKPISQKKKLKALRLFVRGYKYREIVKRTGLSEPTLWRIKGITILAGVRASKYWRVE